MNKFFKFLTMLTAAVVCVISATFIVSAENTTEDKVGILLEYEEDHDYVYSRNFLIGNTSNKRTLGKLSISGNYTLGDLKDDFISYVVEEGQNLKFHYTFDKSYYHEDKWDWHLVDEGANIIDDFKLEDDIGYGAVIQLTSLDHEHWFLKEDYTNIVKSADADTASKNFSTNEVELSNGCYYRFIVAYKLELENKDQIKRVAEVYEFYAEYPSAEQNKVSENDNKYTLGETVYAGNDDGFSKKEEITASDPHYGWEIGNFFISGYTSSYEDNTFTKNVGDRVTLWFSLKQNDLNKLNGDSSLYIAEDTNGFDQQFQTGHPNFKHGALIVRYTNHEGIKSEPQIYTDYLAALSSPSADKKIQLFEEGDYEVALDYQVNKDVAVIADPEYDYRISFNFKIRNGNCMVYPIDVVTGEELPNTAVTENGFKLDLARSRYLKTQIEYSRIIKTENGYNEDPRKNMDSKDGAEFTDEGIYTITVTNPTTGAQTEKKIYVGKDNIVKASINPENKDLTINQIAAKVYDGATISEDGTIIDPPPKESEAESSSLEENDTDSVVEAAAETSLNETDSNSAVSDNSVAESEKKFDFPIVPVAAGAGGVLLIVLIGAVFRKTKGGKKNE